jgi:predicted amidophosphoribosyltransferase
VRERELGLRAMEEQLGQRLSHCPVCRAAVEPEFLVCPVCTTKLKQACVSCKAPLEPLWQVCPYCETPIVRRSSVFDESLSPDTLHEPLRLPRSGRGYDEDTAENLSSDK